MVLAIVCILHDGVPVSAGAHLHCSSLTLRGCVGIYHCLHLAYNAPGGPRVILHCSSLTLRGCVGIDHYLHLAYDAPGGSGFILHCSSSTLLNLGYGDFVVIGFRQAYSRVESSSNLSLLI